MSLKRNKNARKKKANIIRSKERIKANGEVFTPKPLVNEILDKLPLNVFTDKSKTFLDPACGDGAFLTQVILKKIQNGSPITLALHTTYGVDIMADNVAECKQKLLDLVGDIPLHREIVDNNIVCGDSLNGAAESIKPFPLHKQPYIISEDDGIVHQTNTQTGETLTAPTYHDDMVWQEAA